MNVDTNHLVMISSEEEAKLYAQMGYEKVPEEMTDAANLELAGREECHVGKHSSGTLSAWARSKRAEKAKRKQSKLRRVPGCKA